MTTEITHEFVLDNIEDIVQLMRKLHPNKESRNWSAALKKPDVITNLTYLGYIMLYKNTAKVTSKIRDYHDRMDHFHIKEDLLEERILNQVEKEEKMNEHVKTWRHIAQNMRLDMIEQKGCNEFDRWVNDTLGNLPAYYGL
tara:strand:+ start:626 stop:1048 length:423 start_codon:yes stop_codon:yes gene_type:complete